MTAEDLTPQQLETLVEQTGRQVRYLVRLCERMASFHDLVPPNHWESTETAGRCTGVDVSAARKSAQQDR